MTGLISGMVMWNRRTEHLWQNFTMKLRRAADCGCGRLWRYASNGMGHCGRRWHGIGDRQLAGRGDGAGRLTGRVYGGAVSA